jgi:glycosyltransferase involved in cell wall biosynthesis
LKNKILEAMAAGLPVVTTPLGCEGIAAVDGDHVLLGPDSRALSMAVKRLLDDPGLSKRIGETARRFVAEHHTWAHIAARYEALYAETIAERSG